MPKPITGQICNLDDLYIILGRMSESDRKEFSPLVRMPNGGVFSLVEVTTEGYKPDGCRAEQPVFLPE